MLSVANKPIMLNAVAPRMGPISKSVALHKAEKASLGQML
jgi:hypothetical protein